MKLSIETKHALSALSELAARPPGAIVLSADIAESTGTSAAFLSKILQRLATAGLVRGHRGRVRGYSLGAEPHRINARHVIEAVDGPALARRCIFWSSECSDSNPCMLHDTWSAIRPALLAELEALTVAELADSRRSPNRRTRRTKRGD